MRKLSIYLAGPITDVSVEEAKGWREEFRAKYNDRVDIYSPLDRDPDYEDKTGKELKMLRIR